MSKKSFASARGIPFYKSWRNMIYRCTSDKCSCYSNYGGRGISVCEEWLDFWLFERDMGNNYFAGATIERVDVNGNYEPSNCIWITKADQSKNKRRVGCFSDMEKLEAKLREIYGDDYIEDRPVVHFNERKKTSLMKDSALLDYMKGGASVKDAASFFGVTIGCIYSRLKPLKYKKLI